MKQVTIRNTADFILVSYGNGLAYSLIEHNGLRRSVYVQGDDASQFAEELEAAEAAHPERASDVILRDIFIAYNTGA